MSISGKIYVWVPRDNGVYVCSIFFCGGTHTDPHFQYQLYSGGPNPPEQFARVRLTGDATKVVLEITSEAFQVGLFEPCIISTMLLFSARNIDWSSLRFPLGRLTISHQPLRMNYHLVLTLASLPTTVSHHSPLLYQYCYLWLCIVSISYL